MEKTPYHGSIVAYVECSAHQYGHTVRLDGGQAWIDEQGALWLDFGDGNICFPAQWNFVTDEDIKPDCVYPRDDLPTLEFNVSGDGKEAEYLSLSAFQDVA